MIQIYTGNGKGKTTAAMGLALRAIGHGMTVCIVQFFKNKKYYGEQKIFSKIKNLEFCSFAQKHPRMHKNVKIRDTKNDCGRALKKIKSIIRSGKCDVLILDELNVAARDRFISIKELLKILKNKTGNMEIVITGRGAPPQLMEIADIISEIKAVKHPYEKGIKYRKGIEF